MKMYFSDYIYTHILPVKTFFALEILRGIGGGEWGKPPRHPGQGSSSVLGE